jgi:hypothetical protein
LLASRKTLTSLFTTSDIAVSIASKPCFISCCWSAPLLISIFYIIQNIPLWIMV